MRAPAVALSVAAILLATAGPAAATPGEACSGEASVAWEVDHADLAVTGAVVTVLGCADGEPVGLQVLTDDGDVPDEFVFASVVDERATFDLTPYGLSVEPTTGVRVALEVEPPDPVLPDDGGVGDDGADDGRGDPDPDDGRDDDGASDGDETDDGDGDGVEVLPTIIERDDGRTDDTTDVLGSQLTRPGTGALPFTGTSTLVLLGIAIGLLVAGTSALARRDHRRR